MAVVVKRILEYAGNVLVNKDSTTTLWAVVLLHFYSGILLVSIPHEIPRLGKAQRGVSHQLAENTLINSHSENFILLTKPS